MRSSILAALIFTACAREEMNSSMSNHRISIESGNDSPQPTEPALPGTNPQIDTDPTVPAEPPAVTPEPPTNPPVYPPVHPPVEPPPVKPETPPLVEGEINTDHFTPLLWEKSIRIAKQWSQMVYTVITREERSLLEIDAANDVKTFCPRYRSLNVSQRLNFWGQFIAALALPESSWIPTSQMIETTMSKDPVTQKQVRSEGLLQLSYQDEKNYHINCGFNWEKDKLLAEKDPNRTILDPYLNLRCGIKILAIQLKNKKNIVLSKNVYWSVLRQGGKYSKISEISKNTKTLKFCQGK